RRHTRFSRDWSSDVCSSDLYPQIHPSYAHSLYPSLQHTGFKPRQLFGLMGEKRRDDLDSLAGLIPRARPIYRARNNYLIHTRAGRDSRGGRRKKEEGRRKKEEGRRSAASGRTFLLPSFFSLLPLDKIPRRCGKTPFKKGSSRFTGERGSDFEEEVVGVAVAVGHALDDLDAVVDAFEDAGIKAVTG